MKLVIFSGGTGSIALQTGLNNLFNNLEINVITNLYDNGKSTGAVRQVMDGKILGPSDLRKNQTLRHKLLYGETQLYKFMDIRFDCSAEDAEQYCIHELNKLENNDEFKDVAFDAIKTYFLYPKSRQITYSDFSISNIIYAGLAAKHNYSMEAAGIEMAKLLKIEEDAVIPSSDESLFLQAITKSGHIILDEGDIVNWNNPKDKIDHIRLVDTGGIIRLPHLTQRAKNAIQNADIIVLSSGTQWSSLIPTYISVDFEKTFESSNAFKSNKIFCIINNIQDKDMSGVNSYEMIKIISEYINIKNVHFIFNKNASDEMSVNNISKDDKSSINYSVYTLSENKNDKKHHPESLAWAIMHSYYKKYLNSHTYAFDYDDTLVGRNNEYYIESQTNKLLLWTLTKFNKNINIITGNSEKSINLTFKKISSNTIDKSIISSQFFNKVLSQNYSVLFNNITLYADGGINKYLLEYIPIKYDEVNKKYINCVHTPSTFSEKEINDILTILEELGFEINKIQNRNNATISIKPIENEYRKPLSILLQMKLGSNYYVRPTGRTTIDISKGSDAKLKALNDIIKDMDDNTKIVYVGDEGMSGGNDYAIAHSKNVDFLQVKNPRETLIFLKTLLLTLDKNN
jgi:2-phospho-L-lactate transferase/gluconeogenesis factor (CofD/UPF0052 family)